MKHCLAVVVPGHDHAEGVGQHVALLPVPNVRLRDGPLEDVQPPGLDGNTHGLAELTH